MTVLLRRKLVDILALLFATAATLFGLVGLAWILWTTVAVVMLSIGLLTASVFSVGAR